MDPEVLKQIIAGCQNLDHIPPDMIMKARNLMNTRKGREMLKDLEKQGITQESIGQLIDEQKQVRKTGLIIRQNGIIKSKLITTECPIQATDPQFIIVNINNINITAWYDKKNNCVNKKASKILGQTVGGQVVLVSENDLTYDMIL